MINLNCILGRHNWDGCKCTSCGKIRKYPKNIRRYPNFHKWNGCRCAACGEQRDSGHNWNGEMVCRICGRCGLPSSLEIALGNDRHRTYSGNEILDYTKRELAALDISEENKVTDLMTSVENQSVFNVELEIKLVSEAVALIIEFFEKKAWPDLRFETRQNYCPHIFCMREAQRRFTDYLYLAKKSNDVFFVFEIVTEYD